MDEIVLFLRQNIMGKALYTDELTYTLENGALEGVYSDQMSFANLLASPTGMRFDLFVVSRERIYEMDGRGTRSGLRKDFSGASHFHYELARRKSGGEITGFVRYVAASFDDVPAEAMASAVTRMRFDGTALSWEEREVVYRDQPASGGGHRSVAFEARCRFCLRDGKARYEYDGVCFDVDPADFSRRRSDSAFPKFIAVER